MHSQSPGRVIVGVDDSLAGLQALREAVGIARQRGMEVLAVRTYEHPLPAESGFDCWPVAARSPAFMSAPPSLDACAQLARVFVGHAFSEAMGGVPADVRVDIVTTYERPHRALTAAAELEADLLVIGASRQHPWRPFHYSPGRYCAAHAVCPVLIVPPHQGVRELGRASRSWHWLRRRREFSSLTGSVSP